MILEIIIILIIISFFVYYYIVLSIFSTILFNDLIYIEHPRNAYYVIYI